MTLSRLNTYYFISIILCAVLFSSLFNNFALAYDNGNIASGSAYVFYIDEKTGAFENTHKFTGKELDSETGLYYYGQRYYDPAIGRFASEDPAFLAVGDNDELKDITKLDLAKYLANPQLANSYSYTANNPLKFVDKEGEFLDTVIDAGFIVSDIRGIYQDIKNGNNPTIGAVALGFDVVGAFTPGITGLGAGARALMGAEKVGEGVNIANDAKTGFKSFSAFKRVAGSADKGKQWHHIVEQKINKNNFTPEQIHSFENLIEMPKEIHQKISGFYSSKIPSTGNQTVRQWISQKPFQQQYDFGKKTINKFMK